jgi:acetyl esterase/lipase
MDPLPHPAGLEAAENHRYREVSGAALSVYILRPPNPAKKSPAFLGFFGGGWRTGTPSRMLPLAKRLNDWGITAVLADYRTQERFGTGPLEAVDDAIAAQQWLIRQAGSLGFDPTRLLVGGMSAGGYLALRAAIAAADSAPCGLILLYPVSDLTAAGHTVASQHFQTDLAALSIGPLLPARMPPTIIFHGTEDRLVPLSNSRDLQSRLEAGGNRCEIVELVGRPHGVGSPREWEYIFGRLHPFLSQLQLLPT